VSKLKPMDLAFFALENQHRPMHMAAFELFELPKNSPKNFIPKLVKAFRSGAVAPPFNQKIKWLRDGVARWETVEPDLSYHVRHIAVPRPGSMAQLYEMVSFLNTPLLDRAYPLWDAHVIEGIEDNRFAILIRVHHACIDGGAGMRIFQRSLSTSAKDKTIRAPWHPFDSPKKVKRSRSAATSEMKKLIARLNKLPTGARELGGSLANFGAQAMGLKPRSIAMPFSATKSSYNTTATSSARRYANCELSLPVIKSVAKASGATVNDVVMTIIDAALHRYLSEQGEDFQDRLIALMAMSLRDPKDPASTGNQVSAVLVPMGDSDSLPVARLAQIQASTQRVKTDARKLPPTLLQVYTLLVAGSSALADIHPILNKLPNANVLISNMAGPREQLYLCGARLQGFHGLPIVPPGVGVNVTFLSVADSICLGVGAVPEALPSPMRVTQLIQEFLQQLETKLIKPARKRKNKPQDR